MAAEALRERLAWLDKGPAALVAAHPRGVLVRGSPGMGAISAAEFIAAAGDVSRFRSPAALAAAAGLAPVPRRSGCSHTLRRGDRDLKRILHLGAFSACATHSESRAYYDRRRREGKHHAQALIALARQRTDVLRAMLAHDRAYDPDHHAA